VALPDMEDFRPDVSNDPAAPPAPPLRRAPTAWRIVEKNGVRYSRELNTTPQWAGSCWYFLRYLDPDNDRTFCDPAVEKYWMTSPQSQSDPRRGGVDLYVGGVEHAVLHLLYARFWHKVLYDLGHVSTSEPFLRLFNQGYVLAIAFRDERGIYVPAEEVVDAKGEHVVAASYGFIRPCLPSSAERPPIAPAGSTRSNDGYWLMVRRDAAGMRLLTRNGYNWSTRFPAILEAESALQAGLERWR
jgi:hypothetical protein